MFLTNISLKRPVFTVVIILILIAVGIVCFFRLPTNDLPEVDTPTVTVTVIQPGASPDQLELKVTRKVEEAVGQISGVKHISSIVRDSVSVTVAEFILEKSGESAIQDVRDKVGAVRSTLPQDIEEPVIAKFDVNAKPIISLAVTGPLEHRELSRLADDVVSKRLSTVKGVGEVSVYGNQRREINIKLSKKKMNSFGITTSEVVNSLKMDNLDIPSGKVSDGKSEITLQTSGSIKKVEEFSNISVAKRDGAEIRIKDLGEVIDGIKEMDSMAFYQGKGAIGIDVVKQSGANTVDVSNGIKAEMERIQKSLPSGVKLDIVRDNSMMIHEQVNNVVKALIEGCIIAVIIIFLFLGNTVSTLISAVSLPTSIIATFIVMKLMNFTLNLVTLVALSLSIGLLVDDAIVVIENIVRQMHSGKSPFQAAKDATSEIGLAVLATTFTIVAVFLPVAMVKGIVGKFIREFGLTVAFSVLISLFVSFTLVPMLSSKYLKDTRDKKRWILGRFLDRFNRLFDILSVLYARFLKLALSHRPFVLLTAGILLAASIALVPRLGTSFLPSQDKGEINIQAEMDSGLTLENVQNTAMDMENTIKKYPQVRYTYTVVKPDSISIYVRLVDRNSRKEAITDITAGMREELRKIPGIELAVSGSGSIANAPGAGEKDFVYHITGDNFAQLQEFALKARQIMSKMPNAADISLSYKAGKPGVQFVLNRDKASDLGVSPAAVGDTLRTMFNGINVNQYESGKDRYDVRVSLIDNERRDLESFDGVYVPSSNMVNYKPILVPLEQVTDKVFATSSSTVNRYDKAREIQISANVTGISVGDFDRMFLSKLNSEVGIPKGVNISSGGMNGLMGETFGGLAVALLMGALFIFLILAAQYESFMDPLSIMFSLPLAIIGAIIGLYIGHKELSFVAMIGIILLMGLVTKNAILLVDFTRQRRNQGLERKAAILEAASVRLRPIMMTTLAMIVSMVPVIAEGGAGAEFRSPMAYAVIGGLITSTLLTLFVIPVMYTLLDDLRGLFSRNRLVKSKVNVYQGSKEGL